jgi:hypothetical protein
MAPLHLPPGLERGVVAAAAAAQHAPRPRVCRLERVGCRVCLGNEHGKALRPQQLRQPQAAARRALGKGVGGELAVRLCHAWWRRREACAAAAAVALAVAAGAGARHHKRLRLGGGGAAEGV